jgi:hypothetical protein
LGEHPQPQEVLGRRLLNSGVGLCDLGRDRRLPGRAAVLGTGRVAGGHIGCSSGGRRWFEAGRVPCRAQGDLPPALQCSTLSRCLGVGRAPEREPDSITTSVPGRGCSTVAVRQPSKLFTRVRFPSPASVRIGYHGWRRAGVAQSAERNLAKVEVAGSKPVSRSIRQDGWRGVPQLEMNSVWTLDARFLDGA